MKVKHNAAHLRRRVLPSVLIGIMLCNAAPAALAQVAYSSVNDDASASTRVLEMFRGEVRILHLPGTIKRIAIGNGKLITANVVDGSLMLLGEQDGMTSLVVWNEKGIALQTTVRIAKAEVNASLEQLRAVLKSVSGLRIDAIGSNIVLSGTVHRDMAGIVKSATQDMKNVIDTTSIDEGDALKKTVHFKVQIMEVTRNAQKNLGISWDSKFNGPQIGGATSVATGAAKAVTAGTSYFLAGLASNITSQINFAIDNGDAYVLAAPELNTKSGGTASFLAGGEVPIPQSGALGTTNVEYKQYGIKLSIIPVVDANNIISAHLTTEISQIDPTVSYGGMPGFLTRNTSSDISMRAGETLAISGLVSADAVNDSNGMPFLGQLPIIGQLFRSDSFRAKKSDLVIFVTPVISDPELAPNTDLLARADRMDQGYRKEYGNPNPLIADQDKTSLMPAPRQRIEPTPALLPSPIRSAPPQAPTGEQAPASTALPRQPSIEAAPEPASKASAQPAPPQPSVSAVPAGVAEALQLLTAAQRPPVAQNATSNAAQPSGNGKVAPQVGVLGNSSD
ncbi:Type 3 secretion system secretin [Paraburkholderia domus]|jgi:Flp pilus assembly protein, secretin CpaC|uniref:Type 3 secretion system secretin n=1 Tax=Paraburkholderia domus TaxID=2793075 RepID=A0A9N8QZ65_9BURK|nr:pilus assembly protein N-terminal domain-containing protein [Paraburkholderia domus]MBK5050928.1 pilus assembly protein N-terminal domain-containing protein [Burkholderia sp. R-70006]MBK5061067.1 pilus assembly protein N-terminal domain-containing protein [Burkholderia sp. R-70199]MBK5088203.1 pilus assembly protein N-terminal domain-containing protein [Burkholderia sp. R-69927]MBK5121205.1 pilus assembly protein N-terminal domain-containing protein [Burkholderia sp. R-69980]MBK5166262.1 pi